MAMEFNEKLAELRRQKGLTQEELAAKLYVSRTAVSKWESGRGFPAVDSLQAIAKFFSVSLDSLLSTDEALILAEKEHNRRSTHFLDLAYGLLDLGFVLFFLLPFFADRMGELTHAVVLTALSSIRPYLRICYLVAVIATLATGISLLALQNCRAPLWQKLKVKLSLGLGTAAVLLFTVSTQPYAAAFAFALLAIKAILLINRA